MNKSDHKPTTLAVVAAFAAIYVIWGSTYLAIRYAVETIPPLIMAGTRFVIAGSILYAFIRLRGVPAPSRIYWRSTAIIGGLLLLGGNGGVVIAEQTIPSSVAAVLIVSVPFWMVLLDWLRPAGVRPTLGVAAGVLIGVFGVILLLWKNELADGQRLDRAGALILVAGSFCWSLGSIWSRSIKLPSSPLMATAMEMLCGGVLLFIAGFAIGEGPKISLDRVSGLSIASLLYLIVFGSLIAFSCYVWLLKVSTPARVATYAFVNPIVAVVIGVTIGGEALAGRTILASAIILAGVLLIILRGKKGRGVPSSDQQKITNLDEPELGVAATELYKLETGADSLRRTMSRESIESCA